MEYPVSCVFDFEKYKLHLGGSGNTFILSYI